MVIVPLARDARNGIAVELVPRTVSGGSPIRLQPIKVRFPGTKAISGFSPRCDQELGEVGFTWSPKQHIEAHNKVTSSGVHNYLGCRIPIPTPIRYDRIRTRHTTDLKNL